ALLVPGRRRARPLEGPARPRAARAAAQAGSGQGEDAAGLDEAERARWRGQALAWLRADLEAWGRALKNATPQGRLAALRALRPWQVVPELASLRDEGWLAPLPQAERQACGRL